MVPVTDYLELNFKRYLLLTILDWIPKSAHYCLSWIDFQEVPGSCDWISRIESQKVQATDYFELNCQMYMLLTISNWIWKGTCYWLSRIEFQKVPVSCDWLSWIESQNVPVTDCLELNSQRYLLLTISDWIWKGTCYWLSQIEFKKVPVTDYLESNSKRYLWLTILDWVSKDTSYWLYRLEFQNVPITD